MALHDPSSLARAAISLVVVHIIWRFFVYPRFFSPLRSIPRARVDWQTAIYRWIYVEPTPDQILSWLEQTSEVSFKHGLIRYPGIGGADRVLLLSPEALREVLIAKAYDGFHKPPLNKQRLAMFGNGLLVSDGDEHRVQKKKMLPAFAPRNIRALAPLFWSKACELTSLLDQNVRQNQADLELAPWTSRASLDVIGVAAWGKDFEALADPKTEVVSKYHRIFRGTPRSNQQAKFIYAAGLVVPLSTLKWMFPCEFFSNLAEGTRAIRQAAAKVIAEKKLNPSAEQHDILSQAMSSNAFDDTGLAGQMLNVLAAGHETSSLAVTWACYLLAKSPKIQDRLRAEIRTSLPAPGDGDSKAVTAELLESVAYLRAVVREVLRVIPPAPVTRREAKQDTSILGNSIPAGTAIIALHKHFNTLPETWGPNAKDFQPERWLDADAHAVDNLFLTFNIGPRSCIGEGFARLEVSALLAALVGRFRIALASPDTEPDVIYGITLKPLGLQFKLEVVEGW